MLGLLDMTKPAFSCQWWHVQPGWFPNHVCVYVRVCISALSCAKLSLQCVPDWRVSGCRTALGMYDYIQQAIDEGQCLLERDGAHKDDHTTPLLKDKFASERRKAKVC